MAKYDNIDHIPIYFKIPMTTEYSGDLCEFQQDNNKPIYVVEGKEFCEVDRYGDRCCCWYISTIFGISNNKEWLLREIAELGCIPTFQEFHKGLFKEIKL